MEKTAETILSELEQWGCAVAETRVRLLNDDGLYIRFLERIVNDGECGRLEFMLKSGEYKDACALLHTQKGVTANLGLTPLYDMLSSLMEDLKAGNYKDCMEACSQIMAGYDKLRQMIMGL